MHGLRKAAEKISDQLVAWRRHLHAHPELSGREERTAAYLAGELRKLGYEPHERIGGTFGLTATLDVNDQPAIALRADMDALPIIEETGLEFASTNEGVMHACGHDAHMAMLLGAAKLLIDRRSELKRPVKLVFQPSEEFSPGGAAPMIDAGVLDGVERIFGLHIWAEMPAGTLGTRVGPFMSSTDEIQITVTGQGGHAAMPHQCIDPIIPAAEIVTAVQAAVTRALAMTDSAVVSITQFHAGTATNVIPPTATLAGTLRALNETVRATLQRRIREVAVNVAGAHGASADVAIRTGYPTLVNDRACVETALRCARFVGFGDEQILTLPPQGGGEDFAFYAQKLPAAFVFLGARNESKACNHPHHHPRFDIDEAALPGGAALLAAIGTSPH
jgi:amidohydrolase